MNKSIRQRAAGKSSPEAREILTERREKEDGINGADQLRNAVNQLQSLLYAA